MRNTKTMLQHPPRQSVVPWIVLAGVLWLAVACGRPQPAREERVLPTPTVAPVVVSAGALVDPTAMPAPSATPSPLVLSFVSPLIQPTTPAHLLALPPVPGGMYRIPTTAETIAVLEEAQVLVSFPVLAPDPAQFDHIPLFSGGLVYTDEQGQHVGLGFGSGTGRLLTVWQHELPAGGVQMPEQYDEEITVRGQTAYGGPVANAVDWFSLLWQQDGRLVAVSGRYWERGELQRIAESLQPLEVVRSFVPTPTPTPQVYGDTANLLACRPAALAADPFDAAREATACEDETAFRQHVIRGGEQLLQTADPDQPLSQQTALLARIAQGYLRAHVAAGDTREAAYFPAVQPEDLDGDGREDLMISMGAETPSYPTGGVFLFRRGAQGWRGHFFSAAFSHPRVVLSGDVNSDGQPDVVINSGYLGVPYAELVTVLAWEKEGPQQVFSLSLDHQANGTLGWQLVAHEGGYDIVGSCRQPTYLAGHSKGFAPRMRIVTYRWLDGAYREIVNVLDPPYTRYQGIEEAEAALARRDLDAAAAAFRRVIDDHSLGNEPLAFGENGEHEPDWIAVAHIQLGLIHALRGETEAARAEMAQAVARQTAPASSAQAFLDVYQGDLLATLRTTYESRSRSEDPSDPQGGKYLFGVALYDLESYLNEHPEAAAEPLAAVFAALPARPQPLPEPCSPGFSQRADANDGSTAGAADAPQAAAILDVFPLALGASRVYSVAVDYDDQGTVLHWSGAVTETVVANATGRGAQVFLSQLQGDYPFFSSWTALGNQRRYVVEDQRLTIFDAGSPIDARPAIHVDDAGGVQYALPIRSVVGFTLGDYQKLVTRPPEVRWRVEAAGSVQTPAGRFQDCSLLELAADHGYERTWYCSGVGVVRMEVHDKRTVLHEVWELFSQQRSEGDSAYSVRGGAATVRRTLAELAGSGGCRSRPRAGAHRCAPTRWLATTGSRCPTRFRGTARGQSMNSARPASKTAAALPELRR